MNMERLNAFACAVGGALWLTTGHVYWTYIPALMSIYLGVIYGWPFFMLLTREGPHGIVEDMRYAHRMVKPPRLRDMYTIEQLMALLFLVACWFGLESFSSLGPEWYRTPEGVERWLVAVGIVAWFQPGYVVKLSVWLEWPK